MSLNKKAVINRNIAMRFVWLNRNYDYFYLFINVETHLAGAKKNKIRNKRGEREEEDYIVI